MTRRRFLIVVLVFLLVVLLALIAGFLAFWQYTAGPAAAETPGFAHVRTLYGWGTEPEELFFRPFASVYRNGSLYVVDKERSQIAQMTPTGTLERLFSSRGTKPEQLTSPGGVEVDAGGNVYVADGAPKTRVVVFAPDGKFLRATELDAQPLALAIAGERMFVTTADSVKVLAMPSLEELASWGTRGKGDDQFANPSGVAFDPQSETIYVSDGNNLRVKALDRQGNLLWMFGQPPEDMSDPAAADRRFGLAGGLAFAQNHLFVTDPLDGVIHVLSADGNEVAQLGDVGTADGQFQNPTTIAALAGDEFAVTEWGNSRVQIIEIHADDAVAAWEDRGGATPVPAANLGQ
jgi:DNA-binding beta-propeller fold protein YncE